MAWHPEGLGSVPPRSSHGRHSAPRTTLTTTTNATAESTTVWNKPTAQNQQVDQTGTTTWESSIALLSAILNGSLRLEGNVLEVGNGVDVGGISAAALSTTTSNNRCQSLTMTDANPCVLEQCRANVAAVIHQTNRDARSGGGLPSLPPLPSTRSSRSISAAGGKSHRERSTGG